MPQEQQQQQREALPMQHRLAPVNTVDAESRTAKLTWTTGAGVRRYDWYRDRYYMEELSLDPAHIRMGRFQSGSAPLLNSHSQYDLSDVIGVIESADGAQATVRFSKRADVEPIFQDVQDGILRNISVGYATYAREMIAPANEGDDWIYRAIDWEPMELSIVPIPADPGAQVRSATDSKLPVFEVTTLASGSADAATHHLRKDSNMPESQGQNPAATQTAGAPQQPADNQRAQDQLREEAARAERERIVGIEAAVRAGRLDNSAELIARFRDAGTSVDAVRAEVLRLIDERQAAQDVRSAAQIETVRDQTDVRRAAVAEALLHRSNPRAELSDAARQYRGYGLSELARRVLEDQGVNTRGLNKREVAVIAMGLDRDLAARAGMMGVSDFPAILANTVNRTLRNGYALAPRTFTRWARQSSAPDFRTMTRTALSDLSAFSKVKAGENYAYGNLGDSAEGYSVEKYGEIVALTWETIVNDDMDMVSRIPMAMGAEAAQTESDVVYNVLLANAAMADGVALFHATHANLAGAGAAISDVSLGAGRAAIRKQTAPKGRPLNLAPSILLVGPDKEVEANKYTSASFVAAKAGDINPNFNTSLEVVTEQRLQGNQWYLLCQAGGLIDTVEYAYLEGEEGLFTEQRQGFEVDGLEIKARLVIGAKAIDFRGMYKNPGA
ncbi:hypothetical protein SAMN06265795_12236 [Noviherbaspirillum humi]|uniref:Mu-like prophage major head subunit gpT n=1 Tax=Noviherbaspirillum humi TaxID=1688639 RepID=A0A239LF05_9BURK|nr:prohead protease/major capsid protein fusion protein [Noviherbaspirillum humi]SNT28890.1 hypothetical protein SAMN06265795_12236 [Noviherbaspirillum humi]